MWELTVIALKEELLCYITGLLLLVAQVNGMAMISIPKIMESHVISDPTWIDDIQ